MLTRKQEFLSMIIPYHTIPSLHDIALVSFCLDDALPEWLGGCPFQERERKEEEETIRTENLLKGNPLLNQQQGGTFAIKRRLAGVALSTIDIKFCVMTM